MEQSRAQLLKRIVNNISFIALFIFFLTFYFINETKEFMKGSTTFTSRTQEVEEFNIPVLVLCFEPSYKPSVYGNRSADLSYNFEDQFLPEEEQTLVDFLKSASYKLNEDVQIQVSTNNHKL